MHARSYANADSYFLNMDKLIHYVNQKGGRYNVFYSTPADYLAAKASTEQQVRSTWHACPLGLHLGPQDRQGLWGLGTWLGLEPGCNDLTLPQQTAWQPWHPQSRRKVRPVTGGRPGQRGQQQGTRWRIGACSHVRLTWVCRLGP
jgi:hypothetical protein